ncbi:hypothetical protein SI859A1_01154 [Aurantimonas manganoxydans SI85-9A1]|uniref:Uncharacterized protein n=1 Tax=Aurantimonas manganoxydans (strain ATCC BAA-1229 / DSM 21871 / SI85-9A1) TaxID=287752 RepID=Q1YEC1_AURMS|nr:hypothetical protein SI859A1_01154 [Aurantimonas manganoxydans SI85-9A1]
MRAVSESAVDGSDWLLAAAKRGSTRLAGAGPAAVSCCAVAGPLSGARVAVGVAMERGWVTGRAATGALGGAGGATGSGMAAAVGRLASGDGLSTGTDAAGPFAAAPVAAVARPAAASGDGVATGGGERRSVAPADGASAEGPPARSGGVGFVSRGAGASIRGSGARARSATAGSSGSWRWFLAKRSSSISSDREVFQSPCGRAAAGTRRMLPSSSTSFWPPMRIRCSISSRRTSTSLRFSSMRVTSITARRGARPLNWVPIRPPKAFLARTIIAIARPQTMTATMATQTIGARPSPTRSTIHCGMGRASFYSGRRSTPDFTCGATFRGMNPMGKGNASLDVHKALDGAREGVAGIFRGRRPNKSTLGHSRVESAFDS